MQHSDLLPLSVDPKCITLPAQSGSHLDAWGLKDSGWATRCLQCMHVMLIQSTFLSRACSQVQAIGRSDGNVALHMRGSKYGKLRYGQLVCIPSKLVKRAGSHFVDMDDMGVQLIMGCNGWIFVRLTNTAEAKQEHRALPFGASSSPEEWVDFTPTAEQWALCARFAAAIKCAAKLGVPANVSLLKEVVRVSESQGVSCVRMLQMDFLSVVLQLEEERRRTDGNAMDMD